MSEALEILIALLGVVLFCTLLWLIGRYEFYVRRPRRDSPKVNAVVRRIEQHGVDIRPGEKLKPYGEEWSFLTYVAKNPKGYDVDPQRLQQALAQYDPWLEQIKRDIGKRSWWMSI